MRKRAAIEMLTVVDEFTRESLVIDVAGSIRSARVIEVLACAVHRVICAATTPGIRQRGITEMGCRAEFRIGADRSR